MIANKPLNSQVLAIEIAENKIREITKADYLYGIPKRIIDEKIKQVIQECIKEIAIKSLKADVIKSLSNFYKKQYKQWQALNGTKYLVLTALMVLSNQQGKLRKTPVKNGTSLLAKIQTPQVISKAKKIVSEHLGVDKTQLYGQPLKKYSQDYINKNVKPVLERLVKEYAKDENDLRERNSLRNLAEMEVRQNAHEEEVQGFKDKGVKLVIASVHADCSERCSPWQGKVYSLDGTSGTTDDGRSYQPLENATDIYYTTKKGKRYKNGLLGFNCRHYLVEYKKGFYFPKPNAKAEKKAYQITLKQRYLERQVIRYKTITLETKGINQKVYLKAKAKAEEWNKKYINFSQANNRAYYPSRTKLI